MTKTNNVIKVLIASMIFLMVVTMLAVVSFADNTDTPFEYMLAGNQNKTHIRPKDDSSSMYMYCTSASTPYIAEAWGVDDVLYNHYDCSYDYSVPGDIQRRYYFVTGNKRFMYNYVIENGYDLCFIKGEASILGTATGVWSPDSVYQSGVISANDYIGN